LLDLSPVFLGLNSTNELAHEGYLVTCVHCAVSVELHVVWLLRFLVIS